jgi:23S rRNA (adenine1618-N6)-methyltransferase
MTDKKRPNRDTKLKLHPRNRNRERYNFDELIASSPDLANFASTNIYGDESIDFANPEAVKTLNRALLKHFYAIENWDIPPNYLCPPIPGRADYIHYIADLLAERNGGKIPIGDSIKCLDIGIGANCIYPIIGNREYGWSFVGSDIDPISIESANNIIESNSGLSGSIECRLQPDSRSIFDSILKKGELFDVSICNPPFHSSEADVMAASAKKVSNLKLKRVKLPTLNFGGKSNELWCEGGEEKFIETMIRESRMFWNSCFWFTTLVSKDWHLQRIYKALDYAEVFALKTFPMGQGNKISRIVAWSFLDEKQQKAWREIRWNRRNG